MADLPAKQAQYVAYAEKDSKARNIATKIDDIDTTIADLESKAVTTERIRLSAEDTATVLQSLDIGANFYLDFDDIPTTDKVIYEIRSEEPAASMDLIMYKTGITNDVTELPCYVGKSMAISKVYSFIGSVYVEDETNHLRVIGYVDMPVIANTSDVPTATLTNLDVGGVVYSVGGGSQLYVHNVTIYDDAYRYGTATIISTKSTAFTSKAEFKQWLVDNGYTSATNALPFNSAGMRFNLAGHDAIESFNYVKIWCANVNYDGGCQGSYYKAAFSTDGSSISITGTQGQLTTWKYFSSDIVTPII